MGPISAPFIVRLPGSATTVPTTAAVSALPSVAQVAQQQQNAIKAERTLKWAAAARAQTGCTPREEAPSEAAAQDELDRPLDRESRHGSDQAPSPDL